MKRLFLSILILGNCILALGQNTPIEIYNTFYNQMQTITPSGSQSFASATCTVNNCNLICDGTFENSPNSTLTGGGEFCTAGNLFDWISAESVPSQNIVVLNGCTNAFSYTYDSSPDIINRFGGLLGFGNIVFNSETWDGTFNNNNQYMYFGEGENMIQDAICGAVLVSEAESVVQILQSPLLPNTPYVLEFQQSYQWPFQGIVPETIAPTINLFVDDNINACNAVPANSWALTPTTNFTQFASTCPLNPIMTDNAFPWTHQLFNFTTPMGSNNQALYISPITNGYNVPLMGGFNLGFYSNYIDDICLTPTAQNPISATATFSPCTNQITFNVTLDFIGTNSQPITLGLNAQHETAPGVWVADGNFFTIDGANSDFDANGNMIIPTGGLDQNGLTFVLEYDWNAGNFTNGDNYGIGLTIDGSSVSGCLCHEPHVEFVAGDTFEADYLNYTVAVSETWSDPVIVVDGDVFVDNGVTLTITGSEVQFTPNSRLIVDVGGTVACNNATLTSTCDDFWGGIELIGNPGAPQTSGNQGFASLFQSEISNALVGIRHQGSIAGVDDNTRSGGYSRLNQVDFINNVNDIRIVDYAWPTVGHATFIQDCNFEINGGFFTTQLPQDRIFLNRMLRLQIFRSNFDNFVPNYLTQTELVAIQADQASFHLLCSPTFGGTCPTNPAHVSGFTRGIYSVTHHVIDPFFNVVDGIEFNNHRNIFITHPRHCDITRNTFNNLPIGYFNAGIVVLNDAFFPQSNYAVFLQGRQRFRMIDNIVNMNVNPTFNFTYGFITEDCGGLNNRIYRNTFSDMWVASWSRGNNRQTGNNPVNQGLKLECNDFFNNELDIYVNSLAGTAQANHGIKPWQGTPTISATNDFSNSVADSDMKVDEYTYTFGAGILHTYFYNTSESNDDFVNVTDIEVAGFLPCNMTLTNSNNSQHLSQHKELYESVQDNWTQIVDGGDTEALTNEVIYSDYSEALDLYYELMSKSPDLSEQVMVEAILKEVDLPKVLLTDILASNPQAAKSIEVQSRLDQRIDPLEAYQREMINSGLEWVSYKEELELEMGIHFGNMQDAYYAILDSILTDTLVFDKTEATLNHLSTPLQVEDLHLKWSLLTGANDFIASENVLDDLPLYFTMSSEEEQCRSDLYILNNLLNDLHSNSSDTLSDFQVELLENLTLSIHSFVVSEAKKILYRHGEFSIEENLFFDLNTNHQPIMNTNNEVYNKYTISPNPTKNYTVISGNSNGYDLQVEIVDASGRTVSHQTWSNADLIIDVSQFSSGLYFLNIREAGTIQTSLKLIVE